MAYKNAWTNSTPAQPLVITIAPALGDILITYAITDQTNANDLNAVPAGFTDAGRFTSSNDGMSFRVAYKKATGSETSVSWTSSSGNVAIGGVVSLDGRDATTFLDIAVVTFSSNTANTTTSLSATPITNGCDLVFVQGQDAGNSNYAFTFSTTAGTTGAWTTRTDQNSGFLNCAVGTATQTTAGAFTAQCVSTSGGRAGVLLVLRPAASAKAPPPPSDFPMALLAQ